jgi:methylenetetrahydrofolate--tRNA-(uracil-5-)-methyltransferase
MRRCGQPDHGLGDAHQVPAGGALAVDRDGFSAVTERLMAHPLVTVVGEEIAGLPPEDWDNVIVATGPLTSPALADAILKLTGEDEPELLRRHRADRARRLDRLRHRLASVALRQGRAGRRRRRLRQLPDGQGPVRRLHRRPARRAQAEFKDWENVPYFDGCLPIEVMAERGRETLRHGPMKPVGLTNPRNPTVKAHAIVQLRQDNALGTLWNMVGFQTKLKHGAQAESSA